MTVIKKYTFIYVYVQKHVKRKEIEDTKRRTSRLLVRSLMISWSCSEHRRFMKREAFSASITNDGKQFDTRTTLQWDELKESFS